MERPHYRAIADYGVIGDCESVALVAPDGSIDWWCPPRFDAPSVFGAIVDRERGGFFQIHAGERATSQASYLPGTNVLSTRFETNDGAFELLDFMPLQPSARDPDAPSRPPRLVRIARVLSGTPTMHVACAPRFDYGRVHPRARRVEGGVAFRGNGQTLYLQTNVPLSLARTDAIATLALESQSEAAFLVSALPYESPTPPPPTPSQADTLLAKTVENWRRWVSTGRYPERDREAVERSALVLKLLTYAPTGAVVAAPTCSLPEWVGGVRNWDYRYAWVRDAVFAVRTLHAVGHEDESRHFAEWLLNVAHEDPKDLRVLYPIAEGGNAREVELEHLSGYRGSRPVRVGNAAHEQFQLDVYGELVQGLHDSRALAGLSPESKRWAYVRRIADFVAGHWRRPDSGIWEMRSRPRHFVLSKAMAWLALDRVARLAEETGLPGDAATWRREAGACRELTLTEGYDEGLGAFKQAFETPALDASNLLLPLIGFIDANDPRMVSTVRRTRESLTVNDLVYRYLDSDDGLPGGEATFAYCTFWLVEVLALQGEVEEARRVFDRMLERASPLGLFGEEIDAVSGAHLGNYPQGFPHIGLINAAMALARAEAPQRPARAPTPRLPGA